MVLYKYIHTSGDNKMVPIDKNYKEPFVYSEESPGNDYNVVTDPKILIFGYEYLNILDKQPRIKDIQIDDKKDFHSIDFNTDLKVSLSVVEELGELMSNRGLLLSKTYSHDGLDYLKINYTYTFNSLGEISSQRTILNFVNRDNTFNLRVKDKGIVVFSAKDSSKAVIKRREAIIAQLKDTIKTLMSSQAVDGDGNINQQNLLYLIDLGNSLIEHVSIELDKFIKSGKTNSLIDKLNNSTVDFPFLLNDLAPNFTVIDYITNFLNY